MIMGHFVFAKCHTYAHMLQTGSSANAYYYNKIFLWTASESTNENKYNLPLFEIKYIFNGNIIFNDLWCSRTQAPACSVIQFDSVWWKKG